MSVCLLSIASKNSFVHDAGEILAQEITINHTQIIVDAKRIVSVLAQIQQGDYQKIQEFSDHLQEGGLELQTLLRDYDSCVVFSEDIVPIDLIELDSNDIGRTISISHIVADSFKRMLYLGRDGLAPKQLQLERVVLLPITPLPIGFPRIEQDIIKSGLKLSDKVAVDLLLQPSIELALKQFHRSDVQVLHIDSHATLTSIQLSSDHSKMSSIADIQLPVSVPLVLLMACSTAKNRRSIAQSLLENGAETVVGAFFDWATGTFTDDISTPVVYDTLYEGLLSGKTIGEAFVMAKRAMVYNTFNAGQLLLGNQFVYFGSIE